MRRHAFDLAGRTDLDELMALFRRAAVVICNDSGASHLADSLGVPSVVVFSASDPRRWAPLDQELHRAVRSGPGDTEMVLEHAASLMHRRRAVA
jgi:ADP-heptose:LPS heptosyltransferase